MCLCYDQFRGIIMRTVFHCFIDGMNLHLKERHTDRHGPGPSRPSSAANFLIWLESFFLIHQINCISILNPEGLDMFSKEQNMITEESGSSSNEKIGG